MYICGTLNSHHETGHIKKIIYIYIYILGCNSFIIIGPKSNVYWIIDHFQVAKDSNYENNNFKKIQTNEWKKDKNYSAQQ